MGTTETEIKEPLITPLARKYYDYATNEQNRKHYRAADIRICLEKICDEILIDMVLEEDRKKWRKYKLHNKLEAAHKCLHDKKVVDKIIEAKVMGNKGVHDGEEGNYDEKDIDEAMEAIKDFSLEVFHSYFITNGFNAQKESWLPTVFSTLPPVYRVRILEKYYQEDNSTFVIDKLSKAYVKDRRGEYAKEYLKKCHKKGELDDFQYELFMRDVDLLGAQLHRLPIANNLENARKNFNNLLPAISQKQRDGFVYLVSSILNGKENQSKNLKSE